MMKRLLYVLILQLLYTVSYSQDTLCGVVKVHKSDRNVKGAEIKYTKEEKYLKEEKKTESDNMGRFALWIPNDKPGDEISLKVTPPAQYKDYMVLETDDNGIIKKTFPNKSLDIFIRNYHEFLVEQNNNITNSPLYKELEKKCKELEKKSQLSSDYELLKDSLLLAIQELNDLKKRLVAETSKIMRKDLASFDETKPAEARLKKVYEAKSHGNQDEAMEYMIDAEQLLRKAIEQETEFSELKSYIELVMEKAHTYKLQNNPEQAKNLYEECSNTYYKLSRENPERYLPEYANILNIIGQNYLLQYDYKNSEDYLKNSLDIYKQMENKNIPFKLYDFVLVLNNYGMYYFQKQIYLQAAPLLQHSLEICEQLKKENSETYSLLFATVLNNIGLNYFHQKDLKLQAEPYFSKGYKICNQLEKQNPLALPLLALLSQNLGVLHSQEKNYQIADTFFQRSLEIYTQLAKENPYIYNPCLSFLKFAMGVRYYFNDDPDYLKTITLWTNAEEIGDAVVWNNLGAYYKDRIKPNNLEKAFILFNKAAEQGLADAQLNLGYCFYNGEGTEQDLKKAVYWYRKAAEKEIVEAQFHLGICYDAGKGVKHNLDRAIYWFNKAAKQGYAEAQFILGDYYNSPDIKNYTQAKHWLNKAAEQGHVKAQYNLGVFYYDEARTFTNDYKNAFYWLIKASDQKCEEAKKKLAEYLKKANKNVKKDYETAVKLVSDEIKYN